MKNRIGQISLFSTIGGLALTQAGIHTGWLHGPAWFILAAGFEAGAIGGLADWFAVSALFREIPIPLLRKHTNIIVKNRDQLTEGVIDLVTNRWLSPDVIQEKLAEVSFTTILIGMLREPGNQTRSVTILRDILERLTEGLDSPEVAGLLQQVFTDQLGETDIAAPLGRWLEGVISRGDHYPLWELLLEAAQQTVSDETTRAMFIRTIGQKINEYKREGFFRNLFFSFTAWAGGVNPASMAAKLLKTADELIHEARANPDHPLRARLDQSMLDFSRRLVAEEPESRDIVEELRQKLLKNMEGPGLVTAILQRLQTTLIQQLQDDESPLIKLLTTNLDHLLSELQSDAEKRQKLDDWIRETIALLVKEYHHEVGNMIRASLMKLDDTGLVAQIEAKVGDDLQYIRLNGAVVGGIVGIIIAVIKMFLF